MKRITGLLALGVVLAAPSMAFAEPQSGFYVTPKIMYGLTHMRGMEASGYFDNGSAYPFSNKRSKTDSAFGGALAVDYDFNKKQQVPVRAELEYSIFSEISAKNSWGGVDTHPAYPPGDVYNFSVQQKLQIQTLFVNAYHDFHNSTAFTPYVGAGLGLAFINSKGHFNLESESYPTLENAAFSLGSKRSTNFAWNIGVGGAYAINDKVSLDFGYRLAGLGKAETKSTLGNDLYGDVWIAKSKSNVYMHQLMVGARVKF